MSHITAMLQTHPQGSAVYAESIEACIDCAATCRLCADACLGEENCDHLRNCIRLDLTCAAICEGTAKALISQTAEDSAEVALLLEECARLCNTCAAECESHADMHEHCRICADACRNCAEVCQTAVG